MKNKFLILTISLFSFIKQVQGQYCTNNTRFTELAYFDSTEISVAANVQFGNAPDHLGNTYALRMDIYYPNLTIDPLPKRPFIMMFHGGGFTSGDKQSGDIKDLCIHLARRGFVCATVNYRLGYNFTEYGQYKARYRAIQDGHAAMRHIVNNANAIKVDTSWMFVGGQSAGSLLSLGMVYADPTELDSVSLAYNPTSVSAELGNLYTSGNNLTNTYSIKGIFNNWGAVTKTEMDFSEMLPTVAFHGEFDTIVKINSDNSFLHYTLDGSRAINNTLLANNICSELTIDSTNEHGIYRNASSVFRAGRASCFFKSIFCNTCTNFYTTDSIPSLCSSPVSINENYSNENIRVYPNPFENYILIDLLNDPIEISIYKSSGELIYKEDKVLNGKIQINFLPGIYFLKTRHLSNNKTTITKLIKY